ncbi:uroporphyrinogen-III synthase [Zhihengliuella sp.]|uniref:uroporphyrinogen-III synthase n=1 Tax=Zhihengliuella sp. TaxID=1954483 RepID=UPI002811A6DD|nr:uroporphyrinogen-III synthase [Zhihengliuella sp.]
MTGTMNDASPGGERAGAAGALDGLTALLMRSPDRAGRTVAELARRGAATVLCPLIDFELPADTTALDDGLIGLLDGRYDWMVLTSITTVRALKQRSRALGREFRVPAGTRIGAVGDATARAARAEGMDIELLPSPERGQSAEGLVSLWEETVAGSSGHAPARVFLPQADLATEALAAGLQRAGETTDVVVAYRTVDAPARPELRLTEPLAVADGSVPERGAVQLSADGLAHLVRTRGVDAVLFTSPSIARRFTDLVGPLDGPDGIVPVAIGQPTAAELHGLGHRGIAVAAAPTPEAMAEAWTAALAAIRPTDTTKEQS